MFFSIDANSDLQVIINMLFYLPIFLADLIPRFYTQIVFNSTRPTSLAGIVEVY